MSFFLLCPASSSGAFDSCGSSGRGGDLFPGAADERADDRRGHGHVEEHARGAKAHAAGQALGSGTISSSYAYYILQESGALRIEIR